MIRPRHAARLALALAVLFAACSAHAPARHAKTSSAPSGNASPKPHAPPRSPDVSHLVMGWVVVSDPTPLVRAAARAAHMDPSDVPYDAAEVLLAGLLGVDRRLAGALDLRRPAGVALLNPSLLKGRGVQPLLALLPVRSPAAVERALAEAHMKPEKTPFGLRAASPLGPVFIAFKNGYAEVAWRRELLDAASDVLAPPLRAAAAPLVIHLAVDNVYSWYGPQLDALLAQLPGMPLGGVPPDLHPDGVPASPDPQLLYATRTARRILPYAASFRSLDVIVRGEPDGVAVTLRADGQREGAWAGLVASQQAGPVWGANLVPADAVLVYATRRSDGTARDERDAEIDYLAATLSPPATADRRAAWRDSLDGALDQMAGELIYAVWPGRSGGVGLGGAFHLREPARARLPLLAAYRRLGGGMAGVAAHALDLDGRRYRVRVVVRQDAATIAGHPVATVEVSARWPRGSDEERARFEALFGERLVLAVAFAGDAAVFALGRDWKPRLTALIAAAEGREDDAGPTLADQAEFAEAARYHAAGRVSLTYLPVGAMTRFLATLLGPQAGPAAVELTALGRAGAIVSTTNVGGARYEITSRLPAAALPSLFSLSGQLWRIALSPFLNPPAVPPLPLPPAHFAPRKPAPTTTVSIPLPHGPM